jgi:hypothetical protein
MINTVAEKTMHRIRWGLAIGWLILIGSLFYDPITPLITAPDNWASPFHVKPDLGLDPQRCTKIRETCLPEAPYAMAAMLWWGLIVPSGIFVIHVLGHEVWRRICPLSFLSQIPRALGLQRRLKVVDPLTGATRRELVTIGEASWLGRNHLYVQFGLFVLGLGLRILYVNSDRIALGSFLLTTILGAILVGYLYAGKSWCQYFCPMAPVQMVYTGPRSLLGSQAHFGPKALPTQSMCRTVNPQTGQEQSACVSCKMPCIDIDAEKTYWTELKKPGRRMVQYGYLGMVVAFYLYFFLYTGNWNYFFTGIWTHEAAQIIRVTDPGFYINGYTLPIPKYLAVFITFGISITIFMALGRMVERGYRAYTDRQGQPVSLQQAQHVAFTIFTTASFWVFFSYGARPLINRLPSMMVLGFNALIVLVGSIWLFRTLKRTHTQYERERMTTSLRQQLRKLAIAPAALEGRSIDDLSSDEIYTLVKVLPEFSQQLRLETYTGVILDLLEQGVIDLDQSFDFCQKLRADLQLHDSQHFAMIEAIAATKPEILASISNPDGSPPRHNAVTLAKTVAKQPKKTRFTLKQNNKPNEATRIRKL